MAQPWRKVKPEFVNKVRSFKIDFSESKQFEKFGPACPPTQSDSKNQDKKGSKCLFLGWEVKDRERERGTSREWKTASHLPEPEGSQFPIRQFPSQAFLSVILLQVGSNCTSQGCELRSDQSEQDWWPTRPGWQATSHLYLWSRLLESDKENDFLGYYQNFKIFYLKHREKLGCTLILIGATWMSTNFSIYFLGKSASWKAYIIHIHIFSSKSSYLHFVCDTNYWLFTNWLIFDVSCLKLDESRVFLTSSQLEIVCKTNLVSFNFWRIRGNLMHKCFKCL